MEDNTLIRLKDINLSFTERKSFFRHVEHQVLTNVSFDVRKGETLGIIGRNGCGKSTILKVISGIFKPDSGTVENQGIKISLQTLATGFDHELSGRDNAILSSMLLGHSKPHAIENLNAIRDMSELKDAFESPVKTYSSGMRARLGFSVAVTMKADVMLIDETLGVGDSKFKKKAEGIILNKINSDQTVVFVSHSLNQVNRLCNRLVWLNEGRVEMIGHPSTVLEQYANS